MDLLKVYKTAYGKNATGLVNEQSRTDNFLMALIVTNMMETINLKESEFSVKKLDEIDLILYVLNERKQNLKTLMDKISVYEESYPNINYLYQFLPKHSLFKNISDKLSEVYSSRYNLNEENINQSGVLNLFILNSPIKNELMLLNESDTKFKNGYNVLIELINLSKDENFDAANYISNNLNNKYAEFTRLDYWKNIYLKMLDECQLSVVEQAKQIYGFNILKKVVEINKNFLKPYKKEVQVNTVVKMNVDNINEVNNIIIGQTKQLELIKQKLISSNFGFKDNTKPIASFLLTGPTGVGKTQTAKAIANLCFNKNMFTLDMSTFKIKEDVVKFIGSPVGFVGSDEQMPFCEFCLKNPGSVILFEEIDKCNYECLDILLRMLDEGEFIDAKGRAISVKDTVIFLTTNITEYQNENAILNYCQTEESDANIKVCQRGMRKEFVARVDEVIEYEHLNSYELVQITRKKLNSVIKQFESNNKEKNLTLHCSEPVIGEIVANSNTKMFGARDLNKSIQNYFIKPVVKYLYSNKNATNEKIMVNKDSLTINDGNIISCEDETAVSI